VVKLTVKKVPVDLAEPEEAHSEPAPTTPVQPEKIQQEEQVGQELSEEEILGLARDILAELLEKMQIEADIEARIDNPKFPGDEVALILDLQGKDLGFLIGRKGSTLAAIQHVTRLIVNKSTQQRTNLIVDVEGYKVRREHALKKLALRIADKATKRNRRIALEPMNAYERRIIHLTLRNHPTVTTESIGDKDRRKVTILPKS
jgi:spoIIIJ-associated protein